MQSLALVKPNRSNISSEQVIELCDGYHYFSCEAASILTPSDIPTDCQFIAATAPSTVAMLTEDDLALTTLDSLDHWYLNTFAAAVDSLKAEHILLQFDGLLTLAEVYLNGECILQSSNAFHVHYVDITDKLKSQNQIAICFRALKPILSSKHPRAQYITRLVNERHLRFVRTPVLGYLPGFPANTKAIGPYRPIRLICQANVAVSSAQVNAVLQTTTSGSLDLQLDLVLLNDALLKESFSAELILKHADTQLTFQRHAVTTYANAKTLSISASLNLENIEAYWPHTHGQPKRYSLAIALASENHSTTIQLGDYGFKKVEPIDDSVFGLKINGAPIYLRGATWTVMDSKRLIVSEQSLKERLKLLRDFGFNMLRIPGNMPYECDAFYSICDELGILVFQEFAFTNFDYPCQDEDFVKSVSKEAEDFLHKHGSRACLAMLGGGSEVAQQAGMMSLPIEQINNRLFTVVLPEICQRITPQLIYVVSSPYSTKGLPFHTGDGPCHYFGVGGYRRSFEDARLFKGRFISECLPFAHIPEDESLRSFWGGEILPTHHPKWKEGVARDPGSGWDFSDITDYYTEQLFDVDTTKIRSSDQERYLNLCRAATVEAVETTLSIFRADSAKGKTALVWNLHDLVPGSGWGYIDILGRPKSAFYALARTAQPTTALFVDEGLEGLAVYLAHDTNTMLDCQLAVSLVTDDGKIYAQQLLAMSLAPRSVTRHSIDTLIGHFVDSSYAYRFGPRAFIACVVQLLDINGAIISQKTYVPPSLTQTTSHDLGLNAQVTIKDDGKVVLNISASQPAFFVVIETPNYQPSDNYFHVLPNFPREIMLFPKANAEKPHGRIRALNCKISVAIKRID